MRETITLSPMQYANATATLAQPWAYAAGLPGHGPTIWMTDDENPSVHGAAYARAIAHLSV